AVRHQVSIARACDGDVGLLFEEFENLFGDHRGAVASRSFSVPCKRMSPRRAGQPSRGCYYSRRAGEGCVRASATAEGMEILRRAAEGGARSGCWLVARARAARGAAG